MPPELIRVQPSTALRRDFAVWAVAQRPKVRTVSQSEFAVPAEQFVKMPERLLIESIVDGHRYISPDEDQAQPAADTAAADLLGVGLPERVGIPGQPLPPIPDEAYPPGAKPLPPPDFAPLEDASAADDSDANGRDDDTASEGDVGLTCCGRTFKNERGLAAHRRQAHLED